MDDLDTQLSDLKVRLDEYHEWPCQYLFKFIAPLDKVEEVEPIFEGAPFKTRVSKNGNYTSLSGKMEMQSSDQVLAIYRRVSAIEGVMAL